MSETVDYKASTISGAIFSGVGTGLSTPNSFQSNVQTFEGPGAPVATGGTFTWVKPPAGSMVLVECWGGGGSGGSVGPFGGGGGGGYTSNILPFSAVSATVAVTVGAGGVAPSPAPGGNTTFGPYGTGSIIGYSGSGGTGIGGGGGGMAGAGGPASVPGPQGGGIGTAGAGLIYGGGGGSPGSSAPNGGPSVYGGGGGAGATSPPVGVGGTSVYGGPGGSAPGGSGVIPGGGGAGPAGSGASGRVRVTVF